jgi:hypothetical protein
VGVTRQDKWRARLGKGKAPQTQHPLREYYCGAARIPQIFA